MKKTRVVLRVILVRSDREREKPLMNTHSHRAKAQQDVLFAAQSFMQVDHGNDERLPFFQCCL